MRLFNQAYFRTLRSRNWYFDAYPQYRSEVFQLFEAALHQAKVDGMSISMLAEKSGCAYETVRRLMAKETMLPRADTLWKILNAMGYGLGVHRRKKSKQRAA